MKHARIPSCLCSFLILSILAPANASETIRMPVCAGDGVAFVYLTIERDEEAPANHPSACHGVCLFDRRAVTAKRKGG